MTLPNLFFFIPHSPPATDDLTSLHSKTSPESCLYLWSLCSSAHLTWLWSHHFIETALAKVSSGLHASTSRSSLTSLGLVHSLQCPLLTLGFLPHKPPFLLPNYLFLRMTPSLSCKCWRILGSVLRSLLSPESLLFMFPSSSHFFL